MSFTSKAKARNMYEDAAPVPTRTAEAPPPPSPADAPVTLSVVQAQSIGVATALQSSTPGSSKSKASIKSAVPTPKQAKRKGRPPKAKGTEALEWSEAMTASLMRLRYETFRAKFQSARNNDMIRSAWLLLAGELSKEHEVLISEQCKNKIKGLKKKWSEYCSDISSTGNNVDKPIVEPICLGWKNIGPGAGMQSESLADNDNVGDLFDSDSEDDNGNTGGRKRGKTVAEGLEVGMKAMSAGFHAVTTAISSQQPPSVSTQPQQHVEQFMEARFKIVIDQLQVQNQNLTALVELLRKT